MISLLGWDKNHPFAADVRYNDKFYNADVSGAWTIFKRREDFDEKHGADFLVLFYVFDEAVRVFWNLWARRRAPDVKPPYAILLQDHGGGNWAPFCGDQAPLYNLADNTNSCPQWLLSGCNGMPWTGYQRKSDPEEGGMAAHARSLWSLEDATRQKHRPPELEKIVIRDPDPETRRLRELRQNWGIDE